MCDKPLHRDQQMQYFEYARVPVRITLNSSIFLFNVYARILSNPMRRWTDSRANVLQAPVKMFTRLPRT
jgi:hypothetical protein